LKQHFLVGPRHFLDCEFSFGCHTLAQLDFLVLDFHWQPTACVARSGTGVMLFQPALNILGDAGIKRIVGTAEDINDPLFLGTQNCVPSVLFQPVTAFCGNRTVSFYSYLETAFVNKQETRYNRINSLLPALFYGDRSFLVAAIAQAEHHEVTYR
jgi:hypothetical protein